MRFPAQIAIFLALAGGAVAQRGGTMGGGFRGGVPAGRIGGSVGRVTGGTGGFGGFLGGSQFRGFNNGFRGNSLFPGSFGFRGGAFRSGFGFAGYWPWGFDFGVWPGYGYDYYPYGGSYASYNPYAYGYATDPVYQPNVTVVYPPLTSGVSQPVRPANPVMHQYDSNGQEINPAGSPSEAASPLYLIAYKDGVIRAAEAYSVSGNELRYTTLQHEQKQAPLDEIDRAFTLRLNRERNVRFVLP